jgi:hypothetical protein
MANFWIKLALLLIIFGSVGVLAGRLYGPWYGVAVFLIFTCFNYKRVLNDRGPNAQNSGR